MSPTKRYRGKPDFPSSLRTFIADLQFKMLREVYHTAPESPDTTLYLLPPLQVECFSRVGFAMSPERGFPSRASAWESQRTFWGPLGSGFGASRALGFGMLRSFGWFSAYGVSGLWAIGVRVSGVRCMLRVLQICLGVSGLCKCEKHSG